MITCVECGSAVAENSNFCNKCGRRVAARRETKIETAPLPDAPPGPTPFETPQDWGALTPSAAAGAPPAHGRANESHLQQAAANRVRRLGRLGNMLLVSLLSLGAGIAGTQFYYVTYPPGGMVEVDGQLHEEFVDVGGTKFQYADGAHVFETTADSDVTRAGLKAGDVIIRVEGQKIRYMEDFREILGNAPVGKPLEVIYIRDGIRAWTTLTPTTNWDEKTGQPENRQPLQKASLAR